MDDTNNDKNVVSSSSPGSNEMNQIENQNVIKFVQSLMEEMQNKFQLISDQILERIDEMGVRMDDIERNINGLSQSMMENADSGNNKNQNVCSSSKE